ncbi:MAG: PASTA domain-containing protein [Nitrospinae bacterium]|nr:PASTA domain-containing protein [Nitrospinota bacterium]
MKSSLKTFARYLLLLGAVVAAGTVSGLIVMQVALRGTADATTPSIEGDEVVNALEKVTKAGLNLKIAALEYDDEKPRNTIISQMPKAGGSIKRGRDVRVVISRGPREFDMPALAGLSIRQATNLLHEKGVSLAAMGKAHSESVEEGEVIAQFPPASAHISDLQQVELLVSMGKPERVALSPDVSGMSADQAKREMERSGLKVKTVSFENRPDGVAGAVIGQTPPAGMPSPAGTLASLTILKLSQSAGKPAAYTLYNFTLPANAGQATVKVMQENAGAQKEIYNHLHNGGDTVALMVETSGPTTVRVYLNDRLAELKQF